MPRYRARRRRTRAATRTARARRGRCVPSRRHWPISATPAARFRTGNVPTSTWPTRPLAGLLACGRCGRRLESAWSNGSLVQRQAGLAVTPRIHQRHPSGPRTAREHLRPRGPDPAAPGRDRHPARPPSRHPCPREPQPSRGNGPGHYSCPHRPATRRRRRPDLRPATPDPARRQLPGAVRHHRQRPLTAEPGKKGGPPSEKKKESTRHSRRLSAGDDRACQKTAAHGNLTCPRTKAYQLRTLATLP
jgi:hypothetical protein